MAMMITRFHKLIQSKVVWYIILGVIVITFVFLFTPTMDAGDRRPKERPVGELFGRTVSQEEYARAFNNAHLWQILTSGQMMPMTRELSELLEEEAWIRLAALRKAERQNVRIPDEEIVRQIQNMPVFSSEQGRFDPRLYRAILQNLGVNGSQVEALFREQLVFARLLYRYTQAALIPPMELARAYSLYTDGFVVDYAVVSREEIGRDLVLSEQDARRVFDQQPERFRMPQKVRVSYVEFKVDEFVPEAQVPEDAALQFYLRNLERYRNPEAEGEYRSFDEVQEEVVDLLRRNEARRLAQLRASDFVVAVAPRTEGAQPDFKGVASASGLAIKTLPAFGPGEELRGIDASAPFVQAAFRLQDDPYASFSDPVAGRDTVYVLSLEQILPSFVPDFDLVKEQAMDAARAQGVEERLVQRVMEIQAAVADAVAEGKSFAQAVEPFGIKPVRTPLFSLATGLDDPLSSTLISVCLNVEQGEFCDPVPVEQGILLSFVAERHPVDIAMGLPAVRDELVASLERNRAQQLVAAWRDNLLAEAGFKDLTAMQQP